MGLGFDIVSLAAILFRYDQKNGALRTLDHQSRSIGFSVFWPLSPHRISAHTPKNIPRMIKMCIRCRRQEGRSRLEDLGRSRIELADRQARSFLSLRCQAELFSIRR